MRIGKGSGVFDRERWVMKEDADLSEDWRGSWQYERLDEINNSFPAKEKNT